MSANRCIALAFLHVFTQAAGLRPGEVVFDSTSKCVDTYAHGLDKVKPGLGDRMRKHPLSVANVSKRKITICAGAGTTATHSLNVALDILGLNAQHYESFKPVLEFMAPGWPENNNNFDGSKESKCHKEVRMFDYTQVSEDINAISDTPISEVFINIFLTFPEARFILTTREATSWVASRNKKHPNSFAPLQEPCGLCMCCGNRTFNDAQLARLFGLNNELIRCLVPPDRLMELNVWEETPQRMRGIMDELADFVQVKHAGNNPFPSIPVSGSHAPMLLRKHYRADCVDSLFSKSSADSLLSTSSSSSEQWSTGFGTTMQKLVVAGCELD